jgi:hypothetical protein
VLGLADLWVSGVALAPRARADKNPARVEASVWEGWYQCAQGRTGLRLTLERVGTGLRAVFAFQGLPENPDVPAGAYTMRGTASEDGLRIRLDPERWLAQPPGYVMVGLSGTIEPASGVLRGRIEHEACGAFELRRVVGSG